MKIFLTATISFLLTISAKTQSYIIPTTPVLSYLYNSKTEINSITKTNKLFLFPLKVGNVQATFNLIKDRNGLFAHVEGTGQIYKATYLDKTNITFTRIDSSRYFGYNYNAIIFSHKGIIYSFGGYGFWNKNGLLTHFTPGAEWSVDKINKKYKTDNFAYTYQTNNSKIYYVEFPFIDKSTSVVENETSIIEFDILKKENKLIGRLNEKLKLQYNYFNIDLPSINGVLVAAMDDIFLLNFTKNKVYKLSNTKIKEYLNAKTGTEIQTCFENEGKLYYTFENDTTLRSIKFSMSDFKEEPYSLYTSVNNKSDLIVFSIILFILIIASIIIYKKRTPNNLQTTIEKEESYSLDLNSNEFNSIEINLISKLIEKSNMDSYLTLDELNTYLGIKRKTIEIQKRVRAEAINRINHKFNVNFNVETTFIERTRSAEDRRYFNYIISKDNAKIYLKKFTT